MKIFANSVIQERRNRLSKILDPHLTGSDWLAFFSGEPIQKPGGLDQTYPFLPHPEYFWLTGIRRPSGVVCYNKIDGWVDFILPFTAEEKLWEGGEESYAGLDISTFTSWLDSKKAKRFFRFGQPSESQKSMAAIVDPKTNLEIQEAINSVRRAKDAAEIDLIQQTAKFAQAGYQKLKSVIRPGISEREVQIESEAEVLRAGAEKFPYSTIVGTGTNSAILHAIPTSRILKSGEILLIDAGADLYDYCVDITRVFAVDGNLSPQQKDIYNIVLEAQKTSIALCKPGIEWHDVHRASARVMAEGLKKLKILRGETDSLMESGAVSVFFPHGVGHMVGLKVRDVGGNPMKPVRTCCGVRVRVDFPLQENFVMTVEPGLYFVQELLNRKDTREKFSQMIDFNEVEKWQNFGGIRLEDDILVTSKGPENLTDLVEK
jgi:Xaa-Pro aminopeptidase